jgi:hypothetical protein
MFALFINDLVTHLKQHCGSGIFISNQIDEIQALMFADDIAAAAETASKLQIQINRIQEFCEATGMQLNLDKSKIIVFRNGGPLRQYERWFFNNTPIEVVSLYRYLGSFLTPKLCWTKTKDTLSMQAKKAADSISVTNTFWQLPPPRSFYIIRCNCLTNIAILGGIMGTSNV